MSWKIRSASPLKHHTFPKQLKIWIWYVVGTFLITKHLAIDEAQTVIYDIFDKIQFTKEMKNEKKPLSDVLLEITAKATLEMYFYRKSAQTLCVHIQLVLEWVSTLLESTWFA